MMIHAAPVYAEDVEEPELMEGVQSEISIISTDPDKYYKVCLYNKYGVLQDSLTSIINYSCVVNLEQYGFAEGDRVIIHYGSSADYLSQEVEIDPTYATFNLDDHIVEETPPLMEGIVDSITIISTNPDLYYNINIIHEKNISTTSYRQYTSVLDVKKLKLRAGEKVILKYFYSDNEEEIQEVELDLTKDVFNFDEYLGYDADDETSIQLTVTSSTEAAKATQFYLCIGDTYYTGKFLQLQNLRLSFLQGQ